MHVSLEDSLVGAGSLLPSSWSCGLNSGFGGKCLCSLSISPALKIDFWSILILEFLRFFIGTSLLKKKNPKQQKLKEALALGPWKTPSIRMLDYDNLFFASYIPYIMKIFREGVAGEVLSG